MTNKLAVRQEAEKLQRASECGGATLHELVAAILLVATQLATLNDREERRERNKP